MIMISVDVHFKGSS